MSYYMPPDWNGNMEEYYVRYPWERPDAPASGGLQRIDGPATAGAGASRGPTSAAPVPAAPAGAAAGAPAAASSPASSLTSSAPGTLLADLKAAFPWLDQVGFTPDFFQKLVAGAASPDEVIAQLRATPQFKQRFPGLWRSDGSIRMNEAQYLQQETSYRQVLSQYGFGEQYKTPDDLKGLFDSEQDPNELNQRLTVYKQIQDSSQATKNAFYVYAGINLTDEDLYQATVDPTHRQSLVDEYNARTAASDFDYTTFITRATQAGLDQISKTMQDAKASGVISDDAAMKVFNTSPDFARSIMDVLYHGGAPGTATTLSLSELLATFEQAAIGAAATNAGLTMPTKEKVAALRAAGVDRAKAQSVYTQLGSNLGVYSAAVRRTGGGEFGQGRAEDALFLGDSAAQSALQTGLAREDAAGQGVGSFQIQTAPGGGFRQQGIRSRS